MVSVRVNPPNNLEEVWFNHTRPNGVVSLSDYHKAIDNTFRYYYTFGGRPLDIDTMNKYYDYFMSVRNYYTLDEVMPLIDKAREDIEELRDLPNDWVYNLICDTSKKIIDISSNEIVYL